MIVILDNVRRGTCAASSVQMNRFKMQGLAGPSLPVFFDPWIEPKAMVQNLNAPLGFAGSSFSTTFPSVIEAQSTEQLSAADLDVAARESRIRFAAVRSVRQRP